MDRVAVVTGAASGMGLAIARQMAARGDRVALLDLQGDAAMRAAERLRESGAQVMAAVVTGDGYFHQLAPRKFAGGGLPMPVYWALSSIYSTIRNPNCPNRSSFGRRTAQLTENRVGMVADRCLDLLGATTISLHRAADRIRHVRLIRQQ